MAAISLFQTQLLHLLTTSVHLARAMVHGQLPRKDLCGTSTYGIILRAISWKPSPQLTITLLTDIFIAAYMNHGQVNVGVQMLDFAEWLLITVAPTTTPLLGFGNN